MEQSSWPNGYNATLFQDFWSIVSKDLAKSISHFFEQKILEENKNHPSIVLIPKKEVADKLPKFCPKRLCNVQ